MKGRIIAAAVAACLAAPGASDAAPACPGEAGEGRIASVSASGEVALATGGAVRVAGLLVPPEARPLAARWLSSLAGEPVSLRNLAEPDRWDRRSADVMVGTGPVPVDVAEVLVGEGWAAVAPDEVGRPCRPDLLPVEAGARRRKVGLWARPGWPVAATDVAALEERTGTFAVIEGRVLSVGVRRDRTYLNFGRDWATSFAATLPARVWKGAAARGIDEAALRGRGVRLRGVLERRRAPTVELSSLDMLEMMDR